MQKYDPKRIDNIGKFFVNGMLFALLWGLLVLPAASFSLLRIDNSYSQVLSEQEYRYGRQPVVQSENSTIRVDGTEDTTESLELSK